MLLTLKKAKPAHYIVILDEIRDNKVLGANQLEKITHNLCYLYGRATKAVSICPPAYYAHLICLRARCYISNYVNANWPPGKVYDADESPWHSGGVHRKYVYFWIHSPSKILANSLLILAQPQRLDVLYLRCGYTWNRIGLSGTSLWSECIVGLTSRVLSKDQ